MIAMLVFLRDFLVALLLSWVGIDAGADKTAKTQSETTQPADTAGEPAPVKETIRGL